jgi:ABC-2 type transport system permease protein
MSNDLKAILWKEWREHILQYGSLSKWLLNMAMLTGLIGIFLPIQFGRSAIETISLLIWLWIPLLTVTSSITDAIAGERERHTLETLLASRLSDQMILTGKIAVPVLQSWITMLIAVFLALITVNLTDTDPQLILYPTPVFLGLLVLPLVGGVFFAGLGVLASLHATTVRQAYQRMILPFFALILLPTAGLSLLPKNLVAELYSPEFVQRNLTGLLLTSSCILLVMDALVLAITFKRFKRSQLLLN